MRAHDEFDKLQVKKYVAVRMLLFQSWIYRSELS